MTYQPSEKAAVENPVVKYAQGLGVPVLKVNPLWAAGWPDRIFFVPGGKPLLLEFKRPGGKLSPKQVDKIAELKELGYDVEVYETKEQGKEAVRSRLGADWVPPARRGVDPGAPRVRAVPRSRARKD